MEGLLSLGSVSSADLLNRSIAGLGNVELIGVDVICDKDIYMSTLFS